MRRFEAAYSSWVIKYRWVIIPCAVTLMLAAAAGLRLLQFESDYRIFFGPDNPQRIAFEELENTYVKNDNLLIVVAPANGDVFTRNNLALIEHVTERAWHIPYSNRVDSITNFQYTNAIDDDLSVGNLVSDAASLAPSDITKIKQIALGEPSLNGSLIRDDARVTGVFVNVQVPGDNPTAENKEIIRFARGLAADIETQYPDTRIYLTGMVMMNNAFPEATTNDLKTLIPLSFCIMIFLLMLLVGSVTGTLVAVTVFAFSITGALGLAGYIGFPLTPVSASSPIIILTVAIANCVHLLVSFLFGMRHGLEKNAALEESLRINLQPVFIASVTTAIGFLSLNFSEVPPFQQLGTIVATGVLLSFILSVTFLPAMIAVVPIARPKQRYDDDNLIVRLADFVVNKRKPLLWGMSVVVLTLVANVPRNELNDVFLHWFGKSIQFRTDTDFADEHLTGLYRIEYSLGSGESGGISNPNFMREVEAFAVWVRQQPGVRHVRSFTDTMKRLNKNLHGDDALWHKLPEQRDLAAQYLLLYEMSLPYGLDLNNAINVDKSSVRVTVTLDAVSNNDILHLSELSAAWLSNNAPHIDALPASGTAVMFANIATRNIRAMLFGTSVALVLISLILIVALRSAKIGAISLIPNLAPAAMGFGLWGIFVGEVGLSLSIVMSMTLGIVIDDTVHFLSKYLRARREQGLHSQDAVRYAFKTVGRALMITSVILITGFGVLALSNFASNSSMGILTAVIIALAIIADFLFLPPLLMRIEKSDDQQPPPDVNVLELDENLTGGTGCAVSNR